MCVVVEEGGVVCDRSRASLIELFEAIQMHLNLGVEMAMAWLCNGSSNLSVGLSASVC